MYPGAPPKSCVYLYTGPGEVSSLVFEPPGTPVTPRYIKKESISRSFTCHELKVGARMPAERRQLCKRSKNPDYRINIIIHTKDACWKNAEASGVATAGVLFVWLALDVHTCIAARCSGKEVDWQDKSQPFFLLVEMGLKGCPKTGISTENILIKHDKAFEGSKS